MGGQCCSGRELRMPLCTRMLCTKGQEALGLCLAVVLLMSGGQSKDGTYGLCVQALRRVVSVLSDMA